jgi:hypothetical protein
MKENRTNVLNDSNDPKIWVIGSKNLNADNTNPSLQIIINGNPLGGQSTTLGSGFAYWSFNTYEPW